MKYWNKTKKVRERCWTKVAIVINHRLAPHYSGFTTIRGFEAVKTKIQRYPSCGKFFMSIDSNIIWFECAKDATWFILTNPESFAPT